MHWRAVLNILGMLNFLLGLSMIIPLFMSLIYGEDDSLAFFFAFIISVGVSSLVYFLTRRYKNTDIRHREGFAVVTLGWFSACVFAALPFFLYGMTGSAEEFSSFANSFFESASGLTTTGATILKSIQSLPHGILWWRSIIQWYGGMGIIVFSLVLLPQIGVGGLQLFKAEVPGPTADKATPRIQDTAKVLWKVYLLISAAEVFALTIAGLSPFESFCHTFTTMATGGFSTRDAGIVAFQDDYPVLVVFIFFMFVAGVNFSLHYAFLINRKFLAHIKDGEFKVYSLIVLLFAGIMASFLYFGGYYDSLGKTIVHSLFNVISLITTTGYHSADFEAWGNVFPTISVLVFVAMFIGGMSGSTGGSIKIVRIWMLFKSAVREVKRLVHPRGVFRIYAGESTVSEKIITGIAGFFVIYMASFFIGTILVSASGVDFITSATATASCLGNVGPGLGRVGPTDNYYFFDGWVKVLLSFLMVAGRLELYTVFVLFYPPFWKS